MEDWYIHWEFSPRIFEFFEIGATYSRSGDWRTRRQEVLERDAFICQYCGAPAEHVDHILPVCQGGTDNYQNLASACAPCNLKKGGRTPAQANMELNDAITALV